MKKPIMLLKNLFGVWCRGFAPTPAHLPLPLKEGGRGMVEINFSKCNIKKNFSMLFFIAIFISLFLTLPVFSQETGENTQDNSLCLDLNGVVSMTVNKNLDISLAKVGIKEAKGEYIRSFSSFMPSIRGQFSGEKFDGGEVFTFSQPVEIIRTTLRPTLAVDYQVFTGGKSFFEMGIYKNRYKRAQKTCERTAQKALLDSLSSYYNWLRSFCVVNTTNQSLNEAKAQLAMNRNRFVTGFGTQLDIVQTKTLVAERESDVLQAQNDSEISGITLRTILNMPVCTRIKPQAPSIMPLLWDDCVSLPVLYDIAQKHRPDLAELEYSIKEAKDQLKSAYSDIMPTLNLSAYVRGIGPSMGALEKTTQGAFSFNVDVLRYLGINIYGNIQSIKAQLERAVLNREKQLNDTYSEIAQAYYKHNLYREQLEVYKDKIEAATEEYKISLARLEAGRITNLDVVKAQSTLTQSVLDYQTAAMNNNISQIQLLYSIGLLTPDMIVYCTKYQPKLAAK